MSNKGDTKTDETGYFIRTMDFFRININNVKREMHNIKSYKIIHTHIHLQWITSKSTRKPEDYRIPYAAFSQHQSRQPREGVSEGTQSIRRQS